MTGWGAIFIFLRKLNGRTLVKSNHSTYVRMAGPIDLVENPG